MQKEDTFTVDQLINWGGFVSGWAYIPGIIYLFENGRTYIQGGLKTGGLKI